MGFLSRIACAAVAALALLSTASAGVNTPQSGWYSGNPLLGPNALRDIACAGPTCYAAGDFGTLLKSKDSGATWTGIVTGLTLDLGRVRLAGGNADRVVVGGGCAVRRSNDGGETFFRLPFSANDTGCSDGVASFSFPTANTGYLLLASGRLLSTADGGRTFTRRTPAPVSQALDILCTAERTCLAIGSGGGIQRTEDGGTSWTQVANVGRLDAFAQADSQTLYATGIFRTFYKSTDGGATWNRKTDVPVQNLRRIACGDALHCLIATEIGTQVVRTTDGGDTFTTVVASSDPTFAVGFAGPARAIAAGAVGSAEVSNNAGVTWTAVGTRIAGSFGVLTAASESVAYAGGAQGVLARTADGGQSWSNVSPPTDAIVTGLAAAGPDRLFVLASDGTLQRSDNGGSSYSLLNPGSVRPSSMVALDPDKLILVSQGGGLARSVNGGESFQTVGGLQKAFLTATDLAAGAVVAYGPRDARISTDNGSRWRVLKLPRKRSIADLDFATARVGYALDTRKALWKTLNGGKAWQSVPALGTSGGYAIDFSGPRTGYVAIRGFGRLSGRGFVLRTSDGGQSWHPQLVSQSLVQGIESSGVTDYALAAGGSLFATRVGGDTGEPEDMALKSRPTSLKKAGGVVVSGKLKPADGGEEIVVSGLVNGRWIHRVAIAASNGTFNTRWSLRQDAVFVAQVLGDADHRGAGTPPLVVRVG
jgi:photosystem II stability/assembly factor-like uncharacterized protein